MKWFWIILCLTGLTAAAVVFRPSPEPIQPVNAPNDEVHRSELALAHAKEPPAESAAPAVTPLLNPPDPPALPPQTTPSTAPVIAPASAPSITQLENRAILLDGRFTIHGRGIDLDPFVVPWDLLISAGEEYKPAEGKRIVPKRVAMLEGTLTTLNGYLAAPLGIEETSELLVLFNKWDGCCIGTPPTPFDAVEVKLTKPVQLTGKHMIRYGAVTGRMHVEPFLIGDMLVSMYRMDEATLSWGQ